MNSREQALLELAKKLLRTDGVDSLLDTVMEASLEILGAERGFVVLRKGDGLDLKVVRNWSREELEGGGEPVSRSIVSRVLEQGKPLLVEDALSDEDFADRESVLRMRIRSVLAAPLETRGKAGENGGAEDGGADDDGRDDGGREDGGAPGEGEIVGALYLESQQVENLFDQEDFDTFRHILDLASRGLEVATQRLLQRQRTNVLERDFLARYEFPGIISRDAKFLRVLETVAQVASSELPVLIQGASGTGKELVARALYLNSKRRERSLVTINCGAISPNLLESELFGHVKGAFTGASRDKEGTLASADGGTVFLDEIGELPLELQTKLLRTLQFGEVQPVGATRPKKVDVRFLAATNRELEEAVEAGEFREDLLYRLNAITLDLPELKDRPADVLPLFYHFLEDAAEREGRSVPPATPKLERALQKHDWPGNVRELENEARRLMAITPEGTPLTADSLSKRVTESPASQEKPLSLAEQEKELIELHLRMTGGNRTQAAKNLGISREGLRKKMKRFGLD